VTPIDFRMGEVSIRVEATAEHGMATIWDADVLIWAASQIVDARPRAAHVAPDGRHTV
jgi:plasmid replication initiation protein